MLSRCAGLQVGRYGLGILGITSLPRQTLKKSLTAYSDDVKVAVSCLMNISGRRPILISSREIHSTPFYSLRFGAKANAAHHDVANGLSKNSIVVKVKDLENYLRVRGYSTMKWGIAILGVLGFVIYMFREPIKENLSDEVADVATRSLGRNTV